VTNAERARAWLKKTWPWSLDADGPSEREVKLLATLLDESRRAAFEEVQSLLVQEQDWEARGRNVLALVTEYLTRPT
jgi:hypothetical protein